MKNINVPNIILSGKLYSKYNTIQNYESELLSKHSKIGDYNINEGLYNLYDEKKLFVKLNDISAINNVKELLLTIFSDISNLVIFGPQINKLLNNFSSIQIKKDIHIKGCKVNVQDLFNKDNFKTTDHTNYFLIRLDKYNIFIYKKQYNSITHALLTNNMNRRICLYGDIIYISGCFICEYCKNLCVFEENNIDPIFGYPYDIYDMYVKINENNELKNIIDMINLESFVALKKLDLNKIIDKQLNVIEYLIKKLIDENNVILQNQFKNMIIHACKEINDDNPIKRLPHLYALMLNCDKKYNDIYVLLQNVRNEYEIINIDIVCKSIDDINNLIIEYLISKDDYIHLKDYIIYCDMVKELSKKKKTTIKLVDNLIKYKANNIMENILIDKLLSEYYEYYLILMSENINLVKNIEFKPDVALNLLEDVVKKGLIRSMFFMIKMDETILDMKFNVNETVSTETNVGKNNNCSLIHLIENTGKNINIIDLLLKLKPTMINQVNGCGQTPIIVFAEKGYFNLVSHLLNFSDIDIDMVDNLGETFLHKLCKLKEFDVSILVREILKKSKSILNKRNLNLQTPITLACIYGNEDLYYILKSVGCDVNIVDKYGNTVYHYICYNSMCIGSSIVNTKNMYGITPHDYCKIKPNYYQFN